jgi:ATP-binding cassette subfamily B protein RaxB
MQIADGLGFATRPLRLELAELQQLRLPCILHWDLNHFVVLGKVSGNTVTIHDPAVGVRRLSLETLSRHFTGIALELLPTARFKAHKPPPRVRASQLLGHIAGLKRSLANLLCLALAIEVFAVISPLFLAWVVDHALVTADSDLLFTLVLGFTLLLLLQSTVSALRGWMLMGLNASLRIQSQANLFSHLVSLPCAFFETRHLGDIMSRFGSQEAILQAITSEMVESLLDGLMTLVTLAIMVLFAPGLTAIVVIGALLYAGLRWAFYAALRHASSETIVWSARRDTHFLETLRGIHTIKLFNAQNERKAYWINLSVEALNRQLTADKLRLLFRVANSLLLGGITILVIWLGARRVLDGGFSVGLLIAFLAYKDQFLNRVTELINKTVDLTMLRVHGERLADVALTAPEPLGQMSQPAAAITRADIEVKNVSFRYGAYEPWVLKNLSFGIKEHESVAIVGPSGCGKTTLLKLLTGLLQPTEGEILIGGEPLSRVGLEAYRSTLGVVMQEDQLFAGSIADNISFFAERPDQDRIIACAKTSAVHDDIAVMPMGYGTLIGDMGTVLSGGQKQRVLLARV